MKPWTLKEQRMAQSMYDAGESLRSVAEHLGRTYCAVLKKISVRKKDRVPKDKDADSRYRYWTTEDLRNLHAMHARCLSAAEIARGLGRARAEVYRKAAEAGLLFRETVPWDAEQDALLWLFRDREYHAAKTLRTSVRRVRARLRYLRSLPCEQRPSPPALSLPAPATLES